MRALSYSAAAFALLAAVGCTVHQTEVPPLAGPSGLGLSLVMTATPDAISQDGASQSSIKITARGPNGNAIASLPLRVDMSVGGSVQDYGTLSARTVVTGSDGVATVVYTAPPMPVGGNSQSCGGVPGTCMAVIATATGNDFVTAIPVSTTIRLVPPGVILPPAGSPTATFSFSPSPVLQGTPTTFDASASVPGSGASAIASYSWNFGDGTSASGMTVSHTFNGAASFNVTLTVTNDRGLSASTTQAVPVGSVVAPSASFVFSPTSPTVNQVVVFDADPSSSAPGHQLTAFNWNFGDGATGSGVVVSHTFTAAGTYTVVLSVTDDLGQKNTKSASVTITTTAGGGASQPVAAFTLSPTDPTHGATTVNFDATPSVPSAGATISAYTWDFGDGSGASGKNASHIFTTANSFIIRLTITDSSGATATTTQPLVVK